MRVRLRVCAVLLMMWARIPRAEIEELGRAVAAELDALEPGCVSTLVGGYVFQFGRLRDADCAQLPPRQAREQRR